MVEGSTTLGHSSLTLEQLLKIGRVEAAGVLLLAVKELKVFVDARLTAAGVARERELWGDYAADSTPEGRLRSIARCVARVKNLLRSC